MLSTPLHALWLSSRVRHVHVSCVRVCASFLAQVRVKKGYVPPEEQQTYDRWKKEAAPAGGASVPGAEPSVQVPKAPLTAAAKKNAQRKAKKASAAGDGAATAAAPSAAPVDVSDAAAPSAVPSKAAAPAKAAAAPAAPAAVADGAGGPN